MGPAQWRSAHEVAAVDDQLLAGEIAAPIGHQEFEGVGDVRHRADPPERDLAQNAPTWLRLVQPVPLDDLGCVGETGDQRVDPDRRREFQRQTLGGGRGRGIPGR
jgi:hypothetical protein